MKNIITTIAVIALLSSCNKSNKEKSIDNTVTKQSATTDYTLIGKKGIIVYPEFKAEVSYLSDTTLHWKTTTPDGKITEGDEKIFYKKLNDNQYFLNWIEQDGLTISQIIDVKEGKVYAFASYTDEKSPRGKRNSMNLEGTFEFVK